MEVERKRQEGGEKKAGEEGTMTSSVDEGGQRERRGGQSEWKMQKQRRKRGKQQGEQRGNEGEERRRQKEKKGEEREQAEKRGSRVRGQGGARGSELSTKGAERTMRGLAAIVVFNGCFAKLLV